MKLLLQIAGINILIKDYPLSEIGDLVKPFVHKFSYENTDIIYQVKTYSKPPEFLGKKVFDKSNMDFYINNDKYWFAYKFPHINGEVTYYTVVYNDYNCCDILLPENYNETFFNEGLFLSLLAFDFVVLQYSGIMIHASVIEYNSYGVLFSGPSGIGKSTQAALWKKHKNADIINGDRGILRFKENEVYVYGSPYAGSSKIYRNISSPIKTIVLLEHDIENNIEKLAPAEAYKYLYPRFAIPVWDINYTLECIGMIEQLMKMIPIYRLSCTPDIKAVKLLYNTLFFE